MRQGGRQVLRRLVRRNVAAQQHGGPRPKGKAGGGRVLRAGAVALIGLAAVPAVAIHVAEIRAVVIHAAAVVSGHAVHRRRCRIRMRHFSTYFGVTGRRVMDGDRRDALHRFVDGLRIGHVHLCRRIRIARSIEDQSDAEQHAQEGSEKPEHGAHTVTRRPAENAFDG